MARQPQPPRAPRNQGGGHQHSHSSEARYYQYLQKNGKNEKYEDELQDITTKGSLSSLSFEGELSDEENAFIKSGDEDAKADKNTSGLKKKIVFSVICVALSLLLNVGKFTIPNTPSLVQMEFSAFAELAAGLVVHPLIGCLIVLIKNLLYYFIMPTSFPSIPSKIILDILFVLITCYAAKLFMKTKSNRLKLKKREERNLSFREYCFNAVFASGIIASSVSAVGSALTLKYITLPLLYRFFGAYGYTYENIFKSYQIAYYGLVKALPFIKTFIPAMDSLRAGAVLYNIPLTFAKYLICTLLAIAAYYFINDNINKD